MVELIPFKKKSKENHLKISAKATRKKDELLVTFNVEDKKKSILWDASLTPARVHELWKTTCFEMFFGISGSSEYWELNFSVNGSWNLYHFKSYRDAFMSQQEERVNQIEFQQQQENDLIILEVRIPIQKLDLQGKKLEVGLTSVIEFKDKEKAYFALKHVGDKPDFHQRDSFICSLE